MSLGAKFAYTSLKIRVPRVNFAMEMVMHVIKIFRDRELNPMGRPVFYVTTANVEV